MSETDWWFFAQQCIGGMIGLAVGSALIMFRERRRLRRMTPPTS
jgi:hypothetical protein